MAQQPSPLDTFAPDPADLLLVGRTYRAHGLRGEVKLIPESDDPARLLSVRTLFMGETADKAEAVRVESARLMQTGKGPQVVLLIDGVDSREAAEALRGRSVWARREDLPELGEDEFYLHELVGLDAFTEEGEHVGRVADVMETPGQYLCVVEREGRPDALIPAVPEFLVGFDEAQGRLVIRAIEGLLD